MAPWSLASQRASARAPRLRAPARASFRTRADADPPSTPSETPKATTPEPAVTATVAATVEAPEAAPAEKPAAEFTLRASGEPFKVATGQLGGILAASAGLPLRAGMGAFVAGYSPSLAEKDASAYSVTSVGERMLKESSTVSSFPRPEQPIILYEFDSCPFCKKVREMATYLDLDVLYRPCPRNGPTFRPEAIEKGGKKQFPYLVDPNTDVTMYESDAIVQYLADKYGDGQVPLQLRLGALTAITAGFSALPRVGRGAIYTPAYMPAEPITVWAYEASPFCRLVKEKLVELELPHLWKNCARGSPKRQELFDKCGKFQVPYMEDPNTGVSSFESTEIIKYLEETYQKPKDEEKPKEVEAPKEEAKPEEEVKSAA